MGPPRLLLPEDELDVFFAVYVLTTSSPSSSPERISTYSSL